jgi:adenosylmethionine-8-amino-7-oxononanoate aminotransferase
MKKKHITHPDSKTQHLANWDHTYLWHPFTPMQYWEKEKPLIIQRGKDHRLQDINGNWYIDGVSSLWVTVHGHGNSKLNAALKNQINDVAHSTLLGLSHPAAIALAKDLVEIAPKGLKRVFYSDSGSTAVEIALKMAFQYWSNQGRPEKKSFLRLENAYHGDTVGAVSVGGIPLFHQVYRPLLFKTFQAPSPYCYRCPLKKVPSTCQSACLGRLEELLERHQDSLAAFILEPLVQGAAGMLTFPAGYLKKARKLCTKHKVLLIADEVAVGFGRTGTMFACEQEGVTPDLLCLGKGLTGGYLPLAATLTTEKIYRAFLGKVEEAKTFFHGHTYTGNPLACAVSLANLDLMKVQKFFPDLQQKIQRLQEMLHPFKDLPHVGEVRQKGFMVGIELVKNKTTKESFPVGLRMGHQVIMQARKMGIIIRPLGDVIVLMPPLTISLKGLKQLIQGTFQSIQTVCK